jgi:ribonuclease VapC
MIVLDASALLAFLFRETGHQVVGQHIEDACISTVNLSEVASRFVRDGIDPIPLIELLGETAIQIAPFNTTQAMHAARFLQHTAGLGLSLGDRACLSLAREKQLAALTADAAWKKAADIDIDIVVIR